MHIYLIYCLLTAGHGVPSSLIFLLALSIHSIFEGAALGLQMRQEKVMEFAIALLLHEVIMAFTFGLQVQYPISGTGQHVQYCKLYISCVKSCGKIVSNY